MVILSAKPLRLSKRQRQGHTASWGWKQDSNTGSLTQSLRACPVPSVEANVSSNALTLRGGSSSQ